MWNAILLAFALPSLPPAEQLHRQAASYFESGQCRNAIRSEQKAFELWSQVPGVTTAALIPFHANLAGMYMCQGRLTEAEREARLALAQVESECPACLAEKATSLSVLSRVAFHTRQYQEAEHLNAQVVALWASAPKFYTRLAIAVSDSGWLAGAQGRYADARVRFERAVAILQEHGLYHQVQLGRVLLNLALICYKQQEFERADRHYARAVEILTAGLGPNHPEVALGLAERAQALRKLGRKQEAKELAERARRIRAIDPESGQPAIVDVMALRNAN